MISLNNKNNVNDSVTFIKKELPVKIKALSFLVLKYAKLVSCKLEELSTTERKLKNLDISNIRHLSLSKLIYIVDRDAFIFFINEIEKLRMYKPYDFGNRSENINDSIESISFKYLENPAREIDLLAGRSYNKDKIPLICVKPKFGLAKGDNNFIIIPEGFYHNTNKNIDISNDETNYGISRMNYGLECYIDIESTIIRIIHSIEAKTNINLVIEAHKKEEEITNLLEDISIELSKQLFYSITTTYLATLTKLSESNRDFIGSIFNDTLNACNDEDDDEVLYERKKSNDMRNMAISVSSMMNSVFIERRITKGYLVEELTCSLFSLKYETYNYIKVPVNNLKQKKLEFINTLAKPFSEFLDVDNKLDLKCAYESFIGKGISTMFLQLEELNKNGTYLNVKRKYNTLKELLVTLSKFIIIKKRILDIGNANISNGTLTDPSGRSYLDYRQSLKETHNEIRRNLGNLLSSMSYNNKGDEHNVNNTIRNQRISFIYGLSVNSNFRDDYDLNESQDNNTIISKIDPSVTEYTYKSISEKAIIISEIINAINSALNSQSSDFTIRNWIDTVKKGVGNLIFSDMSAVCDGELKKYINDTSDYTISSMKDVTPNVDFLDKERIAAEYNGWVDVKTETTFSTEDLENSFNQVKEKIESIKSDEDLFGMFNDFGGIPLANDVTSKELEIERISNIPEIASTESFIKEKEKFNKFKKEYDKAITKYFK